MRAVGWSVPFVLLLAGAASAEVFFDARVSAVFDGDTIEVVRKLGDGETKREKIRLAGIDAPERGQPWSRRAKQALSERVLGKQVRVNAVSTDRWGRSVGEVYADDVCVGCELLREGHVWVFRRYSGERGGSAVPPASALETPGFSCGSKRYCREMQSCAEARFQLEHCKLTRLDGDGDGIPCETLCDRR